MNKRQKKKNTKKALINYLDGVASKQDLHVLETYGKKFVKQKYNLDKESILFINKKSDLIGSAFRRTMIRAGEYAGILAASFKKAFQNTFDGYFKQEEK
ncbi:MAG TPA: hypothetical protein H9948_04850 [Candidatus Jeotgalibaca merdavium]|uniref:Uncharacterized protein n=1 Tax=Candidatus Jeotgalibaca merdavium TaxID=2838627 RepID=A0A9D2KW82_9LACT|nr:hypothetical protein [Candidatus Jeotgalibaca merdavium]